MTPTSNRAVFPREVPTARNLEPVAEMTVGIPTPFFSGFSKSSVTFLSTTKLIFLIYLTGGNFKCLSLHARLMITVGSGYILARFLAVWLGLS